MKALSLFISLLIWSAVGLASAKIIPNAENQIMRKGVVRAEVPWVRDKGGTFDLNVSVHNESKDKSIIVFLADMGCRRGTVSGELKHTFFNTGERTINFRPNQSKNFNMVCKISRAVHGDFSITIANVYENPSKDGKTPGKALAQNLIWQSPDRP